MSPYNIYTLAAENGFSTTAESKYGGYSQAEVATAIAMAESGGNPSSHGDIGLGPVGSWGLWQIYSGAWSLSNFGMGGQSFQDAMSNPINNAKAAYVVSNKGSNFHPWTTYWSTDGGRSNSGNGNGAFKQYLPQARQASLQANASGGSTANLLFSGSTNAQGAPSSSNDVSAGASDVGGFLTNLNPATALLNWLKGGIMRAAFFIGGLILLVFFLFKAGG
jgi:hypothetical protein